MFKNRLRQLRHEKKWSQQQLAEKLDITQGMIGHYEKGIKYPSAETLIRLSKIFCVSLDYLVGLSDIRYSLNEEDIKGDLDLVRIVNLMRPKINGVLVNDEQWHMITIFLQGVVKQLETEGKLP